MGSEIKTFRRKPAIAEGMQFTLGGMKQADQFSGERIYKGLGGGYVLKYGGQLYQLRYGSWIIKRDNGVIEVVPEDVMPNLWEEV
jgi:hypothetical protein